MHIWNACTSLGCPPYAHFKSDFNLGKQHQWCTVCVNCIISVLTRMRKHHNNICLMLNTTLLLHIEGGYSWMKTCCLYRLHLVLKALLMNHVAFVDKQDSMQTIQNYHVIRCCKKLLIPEWCGLRHSHCQL